MRLLLTSSHRMITSAGLSGRALLSKNMLRLRMDRGWSQEALALEADLHRTFIAHVERQSRNISLDNVEKIATALGVPIQELFAP